MNSFTKSSTVLMLYISEIATVYGIVPGIFFIFSAFCGASFFLGAAMVPETKGRTLEEIQASMFGHSLE